MKPLVLLALMLLSVPNPWYVVGNQPQHLAAFYRVFGGKNYDASADVIALKSASGVVVAGRSNSYGVGSMDMNFNIVKLDNNGSVVWDKNYGGQETEEAFALCETRDGGFMVVGSSDSYGGGPDMKDIWIVKLDKNGDRQWAKIYGDDDSIDEARSVIQLEDGSFVVLANATKITSGKSDILLIKTNEKGDLIWKREFGLPSNSEIGAQVIANKEGGFIIAGSKEVRFQNKIAWNFWLIALDKDGVKLWEQTYGGKMGEQANAIAQTQDGGFVLAGYTYSFAKEGSHDIWVLRTDAKGSKLWDATAGTNSTDEALDVLVTRDGKIAVAGYIDVFVPDANNENSSKEGNNAFVMLLDDQGKTLWRKNIGGNGDQRAYGIAEDVNGDFIIAGYNEGETTDHLVVKVYKNGDVKQ
ncbi:MAG: hypothetical protein RMJ87_02315 [Cytophagales bacterium]|nr:hypothetical protein [Bernardetiaceae bacterium]MDW8203839.1 hypothetical protein [Cytophagales bacterium]